MLNLSRPTVPPRIYTYPTTDTISNTLLKYECEYDHACMQGCIPTCTEHFLHDFFLREKNQMISRMTEDEIQDVRIPISVAIFKDVSPFPPDTLTAKGPELTAEIYINTSQLPRTLRIKRGLCFTCCMMCDKAEAMRVSCQLPLKN